MIIQGQNFSEENIDQIGKFIIEEPKISRRQLSLKVCQLLNWYGRNGKPKEMSCRLALLKMNRNGILDLPEVIIYPKFHSNKEEKCVVIEDIPQIKCKILELGTIEIIPVKCSKSKDSAIWNSLLSRFHYLGNGPLCGAQIRYLVKSQKYGYIGGVSFSSSAWSLESRDKWIGWDNQSRKKHLQEVVCNSRFLIHPHVHVKYLASHLLSLTIKRLPEDWHERYEIKPLLIETFVDRERFRGTSYRAANWIYVGKTKGRGRQDINNESSVGVKDIYLYELRKDAKKILCDGKPREKEEQSKTEQAPIDWAEEEFGEAELGDKRRVNRLMTIARDFYSKPLAAIPQTCQTRAKTKAAYRFFNEGKNSMQKILAPHIENTCKRISQEKVVLSVQDTTFLNYSAHPATKNLGPIRNRNDGCIGLVVHDTMAFNLEGTPLGLLDVQCWARDPAELGKKHLRANLPIEQKESNKWLKSFKATQTAQESTPNTVIVSVGDRESDMYDLFALALKESNEQTCLSGKQELLVRAEHNRLLADGQTHLWDYVSSTELAGVRKLQLPKTKERQAREAKLEIRFAKVTLNPPGGKRHLGPLTVWAILAEEVKYPDGIEPLRWMLITTMDVNSFEDGVEKLDWYTIRWWIEVYHRTLKSGCKIEQRQLGKAERIESCLAIDMVIAWRILHLTKLGRETPDVECTVFFEEAEWKALLAYKTQTPIPPEKPPSLREVIHMVASLGGFLGRKGDGEPGTKSLWLGLQRLDDITEMWKTCISFFAPEIIRPP
ncbi:MAG: IS4 family transposase [Planctomycetes bacterium]|nr:IS4 family transposase [Planctomycetota bacterium]